MYGSVRSSSMSSEFCVFSPRLNASISQRQRVREYYKAVYYVVVSEYVLKTIIIIIGPKLEITVSGAAAPGSGSKVQ